MFAAVAKEHHAASSHRELRDEHHRAPTYTSKQHYWNVVAEISLGKYKTKLHAATHDCYTSMLAYIRNQSTKKPLSELDPELFLSPDHPRGDVLRRLLEAGARSSNAYQGRQKRASTGGVSRTLRANVVSRRGCAAATFTRSSVAPTFATLLRCKLMRRNFHKMAIRLLLSSALRTVPLSCKMTWTLHGLFLVRRRDWMPQRVESASCASVP